MGIIDTLRAEGALVLHHDYRAGHCRDLSGQGNHGTPSAGLMFNRMGAQFHGAAGEMITPTSAIGGAAARSGVFLFAARSLGAGSAGRLLDDGKLVFYLYNVGGNSIVLTSNGFVASLSSADIEFGRAQCLGFSRDAAGAASIYVDGVSVKTGASGTPAAGTTASTIGSNAVGTRPADGSLLACIVANRALTATEHAQVYAELAATRWPTQQSRGEARYLGRNRLVDGDMEAAGVTNWTAGNSATLSKESGASPRSSGSQVLRVAYNAVGNPFAYQTVATIGKRYKVSGWARGDGTGRPRLRDGGVTILWDGLVSTDWQHFEFQYTAQATDFYLQCIVSGTGYAEFDDVEVRELVSGRRAFLDDRLDGTLLWGTGWAVPVVANVAPGGFAGPFEVVSGAFAVTAEEIDGQLCKVIECTNDGVIAIPVSAMRQTPDEAAYGTWEYRLSKAAGGSPGVAFIASAAAAISDASQNGYYLLVSISGAFYLREITAGAVSARMYTPTGYVSNTDWHKFKVTRSAGGVFTAYIDDTLVDVTGGGGTNPVTDATVTESAYLVAEMDAGDKIALADLSGGHGLKKYLGVI